MKKFSVIFLQGVVILLGVGVLAFMLLEPLREGRNVNATLFQVYFNDPFLMVAYIGSIAFFVALYNVFKLLDNVGSNTIFSPKSSKALATIKHCTLIIIGFVLAGEIALRFNESDDRAGGVFMGLLIMFGSLIVFATANVVEKILTSGELSKLANTNNK